MNLATNTFATVDVLRLILQSSQRKIQAEPLFIHETAQIPSLLQKAKDSSKQCTALEFMWLITFQALQMLCTSITSAGELVQKHFTLIGCGAKCFWNYTSHSITTTVWGKYCSRGV